jgi:hypothetical protein
MTKNCMVDNVESAREEDSLQFALSEEDRLLQNFRKKELLFKILVIGDFGVGKLLYCCITSSRLATNGNLLCQIIFVSGKTSIIRRYADGK